MVGGRKINQRHESGSNNVKETIKLKRVFYEKTEVTHEVAEAKRSKICYDLITGFVAPELNNNKESLFLDIGCGDGSFVGDSRSTTRYSVWAFLNRQPSERMKLE